MLPCCLCMQTNLNLLMCALIKPQILLSLSYEFDIARCWIVFRRSAEEMFLSVGGQIGYFQGDPRKLVDDIGELRPTIFIGALLGAQDHSGSKHPDACVHVWLY